MATRDRISEILEIRERGGKYFHRSTISVEMRFFLGQELKGADPAAFSFRYYPIAAVTLLEVYFRRVIQELIDLGDPYADRAESLAKNVKFDFDTIHALQGRSVTLGEIIAHAQSINSFSNIVSLMQTLIGNDFLARLEHTVDRWEVEVNKQAPTPVLREPNQVYSDLDSLFKLRHVLVHEVPREKKLDAREVVRFVEAAEIFIKTVDDLIWDIVAPNAPLTQSAMNMAAGERLRESREAQNVIVERIVEYLRNHGEQEGRTEKVREAQKAFEQFVKLQAEFEADKHKGGTIWPTIFAGVAERLTRERSDYLDRFLERESEV